MNLCDTTLVFGMPYRPIRPPSSPTDPQSRLEQRMDKESLYAYIPLLPPRPPQVSIWLYRGLMSL